MEIGPNMKYRHTTHSQKRKDKIDEGKNRRKKRTHRVRFFQLRCMKYEIVHGFFFLSCLCLCITYTNRIF